MRQEQITKHKHHRPPNDEPEIEPILPNKEIGETAMRVIKKIDEATNGV